MWYKGNEEGRQWNGAKGDSEMRRVVKKKTEREEEELEVPTTKV